MKAFHPMRLVLVLAGADLVLGLGLLMIEASHGINDQDASFAVALAFHWLNYPAVQVVKSLTGNASISMVLVAGIVQWAIIGMVLGGIVTWFRWRTYHRNPPEQPSFPAI